MFSGCLKFCIGVVYVLIELGFCVWIVIEYCVSFVVVVCLDEFGSFVWCVGWLVD